ncbi:MAG: bacterio-opsin activator domain-containing protein, partial [Halobacteriales archaeon]|nr:bacterio-opsin activator domain-containing protein [Halobacteriales archaeon]
KDETVGRNCRFLQGEQSDEEAISAMRTAIDRDEPVSVELINYRKDGETFWNKVDIAPIRDGDGEVTNYVGFQTDITARKEAEFEVKRERAQLDHLLSRINGLIREVTAALVESVTRADVEGAVTDRIASADIYDFAWIGEPDLSNDRIVPNAWAGDWDPTADDLEVPLRGARDEDGGKYPDPVATAYETGELQVITDPDAVAAFVATQPWMVDPGLQGIVAVPLVYRDTRYGVLTVYSTEVDGLNDRETVVLGALGRATATAINAIERGRILAADNVVELEFSIRDRDLFFVDLSSRTADPIVYNGSVYKDDGTVLMFFTTDASPDEVEQVVVDHDDVRGVTLINQTDDGNLYEFSVAPDSIITVLAERGARTRSLTAEHGTSNVSVELPTEADARAILALLKDRYAEAELTAYRERERPPETKQEFIGQLKDTLTDRQLTALQRAYVSGYYEWNRPVSGDDLANSMGVARSTYHQHLRAAERKLIGEIFDR